MNENIKHRTSGRLPPPEAQRLLIRLLELESQYRHGTNLNRRRLSDEEATASLPGSITRCRAKLRIVFNMKPEDIERWKEYYLRQYFRKRHEEKK